MFYVETVRNMPLTVHMLLAFFGWPKLGFRYSPFVTAVIVLAYYTGAFVGETIRAGIQAVPKGQLEAARSLGMPPGMAMQRIILPQAFRIVIPPLTNELVLLTKDSSLVYVLGLLKVDFELTKYGRDLANTYANMTPLVIAGLMYLVITLPLSYLVRRLEAKAQKAR